MYPMTLRNFAFNSDKSELDSSRVQLHWIQLTTSKTAERKLHVIIWCLLQLNFLTLRSVIFVQRNQIFASKVFILTEFVASRTQVYVRVEIECFVRIVVSFKMQGNLPITTEQCTCLYWLKYHYSLPFVFEIFLKEILVIHRIKSPIMFMLKSSEALITKNQQRNFSF